MTCGVGASGRVGVESGGSCRWLNVVACRDLVVIVGNFLGVRGEVWCKMV